ALLYFCVVLLKSSLLKCSCGSCQYWDVDADEFDFNGERNLYTSNMGLADPIIHSPFEDVDHDFIERVEENQD
ncbi:hypothetical protein QML37_30765, partial [Klebsiella pneumoniae]|uniref:hypothetical protein n=1 Tax=Klebsiella pneumoniae TaxID=573 RepID=UPI003A809BBB